MTVPALVETADSSLMAAHPTPLALSPTVTVYLGDALTALAQLPDASVDSVVTDPPYAIKRIPTRVYTRPAEPRSGCVEESCGRPTVCPHCTRATVVAKFEQAPMLGQQSQNWHAKETHSRGYADNDPRQFQTWCSLWLSECLRVLKPGGHLVAFGGTRTWHRLAVAVEDSGFDIRDSLAWLYSSGMPKSLNVQRAIAMSQHPMDDAKWAGWGTGLKPAFEPIVLARRPLAGTMVDNIAAWGTGPLNLNSTPSDADHAATDSASANAKWPTNVHFDEHQAVAASAERDQDAARYFWVSKPSKAERVVVDGVAHPTVKPLDLMQRLVRLVTPPNGTVLDPFAGSGTTVEASLRENRRVIGIEREPAYIPLIQARVARQYSVEPSALSGSGPSDNLNGHPATLF